MITETVYHMYIILYLNIYFYWFGLRYPTLVLNVALTYDHRFQAIFQRMQLTFHTLFYGLCLVQWFPGHGSAADAKATQIRLRRLRLKSLLQKLYCHHHELVDCCEIIISMEFYRGGGVWGAVLQKLSTFDIRIHEASYAFIPVKC